jgi:hypothetical protein
MESDHLPSSESDELPEEPSLRLKERTRRPLPSEPRALFALSMADMVDIVVVLLIEMRVEMFSAEEKMRR